VDRHTGAATGMLSFTQPAACEIGHKKYCQHLPGTVTPQDNAAKAAGHPAGNGDFWTAKSKGDAPANNESVLGP
jgi:hypothetical protein